MPKKEVFEMSNLAVKSQKWHLTFMKWTPGWRTFRRMNELTKKQILPPVIEGNLVSEVFVESLLSLAFEAKSSSIELTTIET